MNWGFEVTVPPRNYQEDAVREACRSTYSLDVEPKGGILCLPCGAGKTMIAIQIAARRNGDTLIFCNTTEVVVQFVEHLQAYTDIESNRVLRLTSAHKSRIPKSNAKSVIMITTYAMMAGHAGRTECTKRCMNDILVHQWHTIILDEVHCAAATASSACWKQIPTDARFGLTATLVRADNGVDNLLRDVGPRLYEMQWRELEENGFTARVDPVMILCQVPDHHHMNARITGLLDIMNPSKVFVCDAIIANHAALNEKIIVFCDKLWPCQKLAVRYMCPFITGDTPEDERQEMLTDFKRGRYNVIVLSRVGDTGWDLDASVGIVVDAHFGSERQEAQRFGRLMRPNRSGLPSTFYDLVSNSRTPVECFSRRRRFLSKLGYEFVEIDSETILTHLKILHAAPQFQYERCVHEMRAYDAEITSKAEQSAANAEMKIERKKHAAAVKHAHPLFKKRAKDSFKKRWLSNP